MGQLWHNFLRSGLGLCSAVLYRWPTAGLYGKSLGRCCTCLMWSSSRLRESMLLLPFRAHEPIQTDLRYSETIGPPPRDRPRSVFRLELPCRTRLGLGVTDYRLPRRF